MQADYKNPLLLYSPHGAVRTRLDAIIPVDTIATSQCAKRPHRPGVLTFSNVTEILWDCAWEAFVLTFFVLLVGGIAIGMVSGLWRSMTPSIPPLPEAEMNLATEAAHAGNAIQAFFIHHQFAIIFAVVFIGKGVARLATYSRNREHRATAAWLRRVSRRISGEWISVIVVNAFVALGVAIAFQGIQRFSFTQVLWQIFADALHPVIQAIVGVFPGHRVFDQWVSWYQENQLKFNFWVLYGAEICDDLGLPNIKTLGRLVWRRLRRRKRAVALASAPAREPGAGSIER
jgi:hypothetical protein